jgi:hypothetical protein
LISSFFALVRNSFSEIIRQPIYGILVVVGMVLIAFSPVITMFTMMEDVKLAVDMGLGTIFMVGIVLAVLSATQVISREIDSKTAGAVISKPVGRFVFVLGKFAGVTLAMGLASFLFTVMLLLTVRMGVPSTASFTIDWPVFLGEVVPLVLAIGFGLYANYFYRWNFTASAIRAAFPLYLLVFVSLLFVTKQWEFELIAEPFITRHAGQIFLAAVLVSMGVWVISSVAVAASTRVGVVANVLICLSVFFVGMVSHHFFGWTVDDSWARWEPRPGEPTVEIRGSVQTPGGEPVPGVTLKGAPRHPLTGADGRFAIRVRRGESGELRPAKSAYRFSPDRRTYADLMDGRTNQTFVARPREKDVHYYLETSVWALCRGAYHVVPSLQYFWVADQLMRPQPYIPLSFVARSALYAGGWCAAMMAFGAFLFERREII